MALQFIFVKLLRYTHQPVFLEAGLRFRLEKKLTITGRLADNSNPSGVSSLFSKEKQVLDGATDYDDIQLNGISFGAGRVDNVSFDGGLMVRNEDYTYDITCYEDGNLFNALAGVYQGLSWTDASKIEQISETFEFEDDEKGEKTYTHNVQVQFTNYTNVADGTNKAKALAAVFFNATSGLGAFLNTYASIGSAKKIYSESYNLIDCSSSFSEVCVIPRNNAGHYSYTLNYTVEQGEDGFVTVTERCDIKGLTNPRYAGAVEGLTALQPGAYTRANVIYTQYNFSDTTLFSKLIQRGVTTNKFTGEISLESVFSNNPKYQSAASWEYSLDAQRNEQGYYTITESGNIRGYGRPLLEKYGNALAFYTTTVLPGIAARVAAFYLKVSGRSLTLIKTAETKTQNEYEGTIQYSQTYTDNNLYSSGAIRKSELSIQYSLPVHIVQKYSIFNQKEIIQPQNQSTAGILGYQVKLRGQRGTALSVYITAAKAFIAANLPATTDRFIENVQYSFSPEQNDFSLSLTMKYTGSSKAFGDITLD